MKNFFWAIIIVFLFSMGFAQETKNIDSDAKNYLKPWEVKTIIQDINTDSMDELQIVQARFCNNNNLTKDLQLEMRPWERKEICIILSNPSNESIDLLWWFSKGILNNEWTPTCQDNMTGNEFSKQIIPNIKTGVTIPASGNVVKIFKYISSKNLTWNTFWCFGFKINKEEKIKNGEMFLIVPRKVGYIYVNMTWSVYNFWRRDDIKDVYTTNKQIVLKILIAILAVRLVYTIVQTGKKKEKHPVKKK